MDPTVKTLVAAAILLNAMFAAAIWWMPTGVPLEGWHSHGARGFELPRG